MIYTFDDFDVDDTQFELYRLGTRVVIQRRTLDVLVYLLKNRGRVVLKRELVQHVWEGVVITNNAISQAIAGLRRAIEGAGAGPAVTTVRGRGYLFVRPVEEREGRSRAMFARGIARDARAQAFAEPVFSAQIDAALGDMAHAPRFPINATAEAGRPLGAWIALTRAVLAARPALRASSLGQVVQKTLDAPPAADPSGRTQLAMIVDLLRAAAANEPVVAIFTQAEGADVASLLLLGQTTRVFRDAPVLVLAACAESILRSDASAGALLRGLWHAPPASTRQSGIVGPVASEDTRNEAAPSR